MGLPAAGGGAARAFGVPSGGMEAFWAWMMAMFAQPREYLKPLSRYTLKG